MNFQLNVLFSLTLGVSVLIASIRLHKIDSRFFPFICLIFAGMANEVISLYCAHYHYSNAINYNAFALVEGMLILWQFKRWRTIRNRTLFYLAMALCTWWLYENFIISSIHAFNSYYIILSPTPL